MSDDPITSAIESSVAAAGLTESGQIETPEAAGTEPPADGETSEEAAAPEGQKDGDDAAQPEASEEGEKPEPKAEGEQAEPEKPKKKRGPIPYDRHEAVLTKARREAEAREAALKKQLEELQGRYESDEFRAKLTVLDIAEREPERFISILRHDPRYKQFIREAEKEAAAAAQQQQAAAEPPKPDTILPDGSLGYSAEGAKALVEWRLEQERLRTQKEIDALREQLSPIAQEREARAQFDAAVQRMAPVLEDARQNWPGFKENEAAIKQALEANPKWDLSRAYIAVVTPNLQPNLEKIRAEERKKLIEEMNQRSRAAKQPAAPNQLPAAGAEAGEVDEDERITQIIAQAASSLT